VGFFTSANGDSWFCRDVFFLGGGGGGGGVGLLP
jgi:hypothetical protein